MCAMSRKGVSHCYAISLRFRFAIQFETRLETCLQWLLRSLKLEETEAMFTLCRIVKRSVTESVPDRASVHTRNAAFEAVSAPEQYCSAPLLKVERSVSDRFLKRSESSVNTFIGAEIATEPRFGK